MLNITRRGLVLLGLVLVTQSACADEPAPFEMKYRVVSSGDPTQKFSMEVVQGDQGHKTNVQGFPDGDDRVSTSYWNVGPTDSEVTIRTVVPSGFLLTGIDCLDRSINRELEFTYLGARPDTRAFEAGDTAVTLKAASAADLYDQGSATCTFRFAPDPAADATPTPSESPSTGDEPAPAGTDPEATDTATGSDEPEASPAPSSAPTSSSSPSVSPSTPASMEPSATPTSSSSPKPSPSPSPSPKPSPSRSPSPTPTPTASPSSKPSPSPSPTPTPTPKPSPTPTPTPTPSPTPTGLVCNTNPTAARPTIVSLFAYDGTNNAETNKLVVVFSEPVEIAKVRGVKVTIASGDVRTSTGAVRFNEDWGQDEGEYWTFTMNGAMDNGFNYEGAHSVQVDTACNVAGDGNASSQAG